MTKNFFFVENLEVSETSSHKHSSRNEGSCTIESVAHKRNNRNVENVKIEVNLGSENISALDEEEPDSGRRTNDSILEGVIESKRLKREKNLTPPRRHSASGVDAAQFLGFFAPKTRAARKSVVEIPAGLSIEGFGWSGSQNIQIFINKSLSDSLGSNSRRILGDLKAEFLC